MTPQLHPTLSAVLSKAKVGGLVLAATVLVASTAEAATGSDLFGDDPAPVVQEDGATDPCVTPPDDGTDPAVEEPVDDDPASGTGTDNPVDDPVDDGTTDCDEPVVDDGTDDGGDDGTVDDGTGEPVVDDGTEGGGDDGTVDDDTDEPVDEACAAARNHGEYVSGVAHETPPGPGHGAAVSEAAHSDCGKGAPEADSDEGADTKVKQSKVKNTKVKQSKVKNTKVKQSKHGSTHVPPGQAKKNDSGPSSAPGNSGNAPGHDK